MNQLVYLNGLKGLAALHILIYHSFHNSMLVSLMGTVQMPFFFLSLGGTVQMPLFFLLSGYTLAITYGKKISSHQKLVYLEYLQNRFARIGPVYYLMTFYQLVVEQIYWVIYEIDISGIDPKNVSIIGNGTRRFILNILCINTWLSPNAKAQPFYCLESWTIHTLFFFYLIFPWTVKRLLNWSNRQLYKGIILCYYLQLAPHLLHLIPNYNEKELDLVWIIGNNPISRLPVFLMGSMAGVIQMRGENRLSAVSTDSSPSSEPWTSSSKSFRANVNQVSKSFVGILWPGSALILGKAEKTFDDINVDQATFAFFFLFFSIDKCSVLLQLIPVYIQLILIVGLSRPGRKSILARICHLKPIQVLGNMSMALYLIQVRLQLTVIQPLNDLLFFGPPMDALWNIPLAICLAHLLNIYYEVPLRKLLSSNSRVRMEDPSKSIKKIMV